MALAISNNVLTTKVNVAAKEQLFSDRRQNPEEMTCPLWNGFDLSGRPVCNNSFLTKMEGCNTAEDRIFVENNLRPQYTNFITTNAAAIGGDGMYDSRNNLQAMSSDSGAAYRRAVSGRTPKFGTVDSVQGINPVSGNKSFVRSANAYASQDNDAASSQSSRVRQARVIGGNSSSDIRLPNPSGNYEASMPHGTPSSGYMRLGQYNYASGGR